MILSAPNLDRTGIPKGIRDNKVLIYSVYVSDGRVIAEAELVTIRKMLDHAANKAGPIPNVTEAVRRFWLSEHEESDNHRVFAEAIFDQENACFRMDQLNNALTDTGRVFADIGSPLISALFSGLPESVDYAV